MCSVAAPYFPYCTFLCLLMFLGFKLYDPRYLFMLTQLFAYFHSGYMALETLRWKSVFTDSQCFLDFKILKISDSMGSPFYSLVPAIYVIALYPWISKRKYILPCFISICHHCKHQWLIWAVMPSRLLVKWGSPTQIASYSYTSKIRQVTVNLFWEFFFVPIVPMLSWD